MVIFIKGKIAIGRVKYLLNINVLTLWVFKSPSFRELFNVNYTLNEVKDLINA
jgi:hypothetical protein